jgi:hypothetical protein
MAKRLPRDRYWLDRWLRRLDEAADEINPLLTMLAIGLAVLNLTCFTLQATRLPISHDEPAASVSLSPLLQSPATSPGVTGDIRAWGY